MIKQGFYFTFGNKGIFIEHENIRKTDKVVKMFINAVCDYKGICDDLRHRALNDKNTLDDFRRRIDSATLIKKTTLSGYTFFTINGYNFTVNYPVEDFINDIIFIGNSELEWNE